MVKRLSAKPKQGLVSVPITFIDSNPHRYVGLYPWIPSKIDMLKKSINDVGFWEGVIARPVENRYQIAFGHHRIEAAKQLAIKQIPLIVRPLTEEQMIKFMARENGDDYRTYFSVMLNTWEAAERYVREKLFPAGERSFDDVSVTGIATLIGWVDEADGQATNLARNCHRALRLIDKKCLDRDSLQGITPRRAGQLILQAWQAANKPEFADSSEKITQTLTDAFEAIRQDKHTVDDAVAYFNATMSGEIHHIKTIEEQDAERQRDEDNSPSKAKKKGKAPTTFAEKLAKLNDKLRNLLRNDALEKLLVDIEKRMKAITWDEDIKAIQECIGHIDRLVESLTNHKNLLIRNDLQGKGPKPVEVKDVKEPKAKRGRKKQEPLEVVENSEEIVIN